MTHDYEIGATLIGMANLADLTVPVPEPKSDFQEFSQYLELGDGTVRGAGWTTAEWRWTYLTRTQRDQLKTFCAGASATAYIKTRTNDTADVYDIFSAVIVWPIGEEKSFSRRMDFVIRFTNLEAV